MNELGEFLIVAILMVIGYFCGRNDGRRSVVGDPARAIFHVGSRTVTVASRTALTITETDS